MTTYKIQYCVDFIWHNVKNFELDDFECIAINDAKVIAILYKKFHSEFNYQAFRIVDSKGNYTTLSI